MKIKTYLPSVGKDNKQLKDFKYIFSMNPASHIEILHHLLRRVLNTSIKLWHRP